MYVRPTTNLTAALLYREHNPVNFRHLAITLNLILETANLRFRVIHQKSGQAAVLSCRQLHISINTNVADQASGDFQRMLSAHTHRGMSYSMQQLIETHKFSIEISVGTGPLPNSDEPIEGSRRDLVPLLAQMVTNHLMNTNPADVVYWGATNSVMTPKEFLALINGPDFDDIKPPRPPSGGNVSGGIAKQPNPQPHQALGERQTGILKWALQMLDRRRAGTRVLNVATMIVAPIVGICLFVYNLAAGARL